MSKFIKFENWQTEQGLIEKIKVSFFIFWITLKTLFHFISTFTNDNTNQIPEVLSKALTVYFCPGKNLKNTRRNLEIKSFKLKIVKR